MMRAQKKHDDLESLREIIAGQLNKSSVEIDKRRYGSCFKYAHNADAKAHH